MFKIDAMRLVGLQDKEGLIISWQPDGILIEMSQHKASGVPEGGWGEGRDVESTGEGRGAGCQREDGERAGTYRVNWRRRSGIRGRWGGGGDIHSEPVN